MQVRIARIALKKSKAFWKFLLNIIPTFSPFNVVKEAITGANITEVETSTRDSDSRLIENNNNAGKKFIPE